MNIGILAHVDAGKTTITEQMLYICGITKEVGRVDNGNATTDGMTLEKARGITIRQTTVTMQYQDQTINLLDTPGHVDFIAEVERSLSVLDAAVLAISAKEGVQTQTKVIFQALRKMGIPTIIMINKVDRMGVDLVKIKEDIKRDLTEALYEVNQVVDEGMRTASLRPLADHEHRENMETLALYDEDVYTLLFETSEKLLDSDMFIHECAREHFRCGDIFPVLYGSALLGIGVRELLDVITTWIEPYEQHGLSAMVYKVDRDAQGYRRCFTRVYGGTLILRESYPVLNDDEYKILKMDKLHGIKTVTCNTAYPGDVVILYTHQLKVGSIIGEMPEGKTLVHIASPTLKAKVLDEDLAMRRALCDALTQLTDEDPFLDFEINPETQDIELRIFGMVQKEIIEQLLRERFDIETQIQEPEIIYKTKPAHEGQACLRMYKDGNQLPASVGVIVEPLKAGELVEYITDVSFGDLKKPFQNAVREGCLRGLKRGLEGRETIEVSVRFVFSEFDSVNSTPSDYRKVAEEVVQMALKDCGEILLEPMVKFELWIPQLFIGKAISDVLKMRGTPQDPTLSGDVAVLKGRLPQITSQFYEVELADYTGGKGVILLMPDGYDPVISIS